MSNYKNGIKILNIQAGSIYGCNLKIRKNMDTKKAVLGNSLFLDFMKNNGLVINRGWTRDIICIDFDYGTKSYDDEIKKLKKKLSIAKEEENEELTTWYEDQIEACKNNKDNFDAKTKDELRVLFYVNGVNIDYLDGKQTSTVHYKMLYRSTGKAKAGSCMFIRDELFYVAQDYLRMGLKLPKENAPIVEIGAYSSLVASGICGRVKINPENILIVDDVDVEFKTNVIDVCLDDDGHCKVEYRDDYPVTNTMFDGQGLIDESIFPSWGEGYVLLRQHMTKMACFKTKIQKFFRDYFGDEYETAIVKDMWGNEHYAKDIQLITTNNAVKWLKFNVSYEYWCQKVHEDNDIFGIVKTAHRSKLGDVQRMSYQMINSLPDMNEIPNVIQETVDYVNGLKQDNEKFLEYLQLTENFSNDHKFLIDIAKANPEFMRSEYFRERKKEIIRSYVNQFKFGKVIQQGDNLVFVGSPYAMLLHSVGEDVHGDTTFSHEDGCIQVYTERFEDGKYLACFRSPHNSANDLGYFHNVYNDIYKKYFDLGKQILVLNTLHTDIMDRMNGCDFDSDSGFVTDHDAVVRCAKIAYAEYPTVINNIPQNKKKYNNTLECFAEVDNLLSHAQMAIGTSSNLAQIAQTYSHSFDGKTKTEMKEYSCILAVVAQIAIDNAKRSFAIDVNEEIALLKKKMRVTDDDRGYPKFWLAVNPNFNSRHDNHLKWLKTQDEVTEDDFKTLKDLNKINNNLECPMNIVYNYKMQKFRNTEPTLPMDYFFQKFKLEGDRRKSKKVETLIEEYSAELFGFYQELESRGLELSEVETMSDSFEEDLETLITRIKGLYLNSTYIGLTSWLIDRTFMITPNMQSNINNIERVTNKNKSLLLKILYDINPNNVIKCFSKNLENA